MDVHGAGSQRNDPKVGDASKFPQGRGPQGDVIRIENLVRCVRGGTGNDPAKTGKDNPKDIYGITERASASTPKGSRSKNF